MYLNKEDLMKKMQMIKIIMQNKGQKGLISLDSLINNKYKRILQMNNMQLKATYPPS